MPRDAGKITLLRTSTGWSAKFSGEAATEILSLFGTDTIPTAFTAQADAAKVAMHMSKQWPKCYVSVEVNQ